MESIFLNDAPKPAGHYSPGVVRNSQLLLMQVLVFIACAISVYAQSSVVSGTGVLLDPSKAPVYLEFVKSGTCKKDLTNFNSGNLCNSKEETARTFDAAWLRLVNNTRWAIGLSVDHGATETNATPIIIDSTTFTEADAKKAIGVMLANEDAEMDVVYKSESETGCDFSKKAPKGAPCFRRDTVPPEILLPSISGNLFVAPGKTIIFPVNLAHVKEYVNLYVLYNFSWEYAAKPSSFSLVSPAYDTQHRAYFGWFDLKKGFEAEKDRRKPRA